MQIHKRKYTNTVLHADRVTHAARYMRLTKGDKVKHMLVSLDAIQFEELFTLGLIHFARYMRLTKGDKVKHMLISLDARHFGEFFSVGLIHFARWSIWRPL